MSSRWISVKKMLPPLHKDVECIGARGGKFIGRRVANYFDGKTFYMQTADDPWGREATHWRELNPKANE